MESNEESEYRNKLMVCAENLADKMSILDARDRLLKLRRMRQTDLATAVAVVGTCPDMCPELERYFREETNQVSLFEMDSITGRPDEHRMVKEYRRSGADQEEPLAHELRPTPVLNRTMDYLCANILDILDVNNSCGDWYDFVWSRTRSIRKDITQQHLCDEQAVALTEKCARFHIHCSATLCEQNVKDFDPKINEENLSNCLQSLKDLYYDLSLRDIYCQNESEFRCYEILLHLNDTAILKDVHNYRNEIRESKGVQIALKAFFAFQSNNYIKFFQLLEESSYLMACILHRYFKSMRQKAFKILRKCYTFNNSSVQEFPSQTLINCLGFEDEEELKSFCDHIGLDCRHGIVYLVRGPNQNNTIKDKRSVRLVENKRIMSVGQVINGSPLLTNPYKTVSLHNSFDSEGKLKADAIEALDQRTKSKGRTNESEDKTDSQTTKQVPHSLSIDSTFGSITPKSSSLLLLNPSFQTTNNPFIGETKLFQKQTFQLKADIESNPLIGNYLDAISEAIVEDMIDGTLNQQLTDICFSELQYILEEIFEQIICDIFSDIFLNTSDLLIKEISLEVIQTEKDLKAEQNRIIELLSDSIFETIVCSQIKCISSEILSKTKQELVEKQNILISNQIFNDLIDTMIEAIASSVLSDETQEREEVLQIIRQKRVKSLQTKYVKKWKNWFSRRKRFKYLWESFPAAFKFNSTNNVSLNLSPINPQFCLDHNLNESIQRQLLVNNCYDCLIDSLIKQIASQVFQTVISSKSQLFQYFQQKREKRIQNKYFQKWRQFCDEKRLNFKRKSFPAAHNWTHNDRHSFSSAFKHSFSLTDSENESPLKRLRLQLSPELNPDSGSESNQLASMVDITPFAAELSESRALTQQLTQQINCDQSIQIVNKFNTKDINEECFQEEEEEEEDIQVIQVFESENDKINRLKRLISEEKDYFSLHNFVTYLKDNN